MTAEEMGPSLIAVNRNRCRPPLLEEEVWGIAESVARYASETFRANGAYRAQGGPLGKWPNPMSKAALHGPIGELIRLVEPHTEADPGRTSFS